MLVKMVQHAVGQGGLHSGEVTCGQKPVRWVYDCGSNQLDALTREVGAIAGGGDIDLLFLSHFDSDHVNGVDLLLSQVKVREVVLPYLNVDTLVAIIARDASRGALTGVFVEAASNLSGWFGSRGVETVTFILGSDDDDIGGPELPGEPGRDGDGDITGKWTGEEKPTLIYSADPQIGEGTAKLRTVSPRPARIFMASGALLNWVLVPYVHQPSAARMNAFNDALYGEFGDMDKETLLEKAKEPAVREQLRSCYDALWSNHNLISMTLYSGPIKSENMDIEIHAFRHHSYWHRSYGNSNYGGWMLTGDAHFNGMRRRKRFLKFYERFLKLINVLMLPHHGSIHNHSIDVLNAMPNLSVGFAAAGPNYYGHPHKEVRHAVQAQPRADFHQVDEKQFNQIVMTVTKY